MNTPSLSATRRYPEVAADLRDYILSEDLKPGDKLPAERHLADQFGVSRALLREAMIMLEIQGIVDVRQGSGVYIVQLPGSETDAEDDIGPFELLQARQVLESSIAEVAAQMLSKRDIDALQRILNEQEREIEEGVTDYTTDERFHLRIAKATQNGVLEESVRHLWDLRRRSPMWSQLHTHISNTDYWKQWVEDHTRIFNALRRKDPAGAREAMWQHLENVRETVLALSNTDAPEFDGYLFQSLPIPQRYPQR